MTYRICPKYNEFDVYYPDSWHYPYFEPIVKLSGHYRIYPKSQYLDITITDAFITKWQENENIDPIVYGALLNDMSLETYKAVLQGIQDVKDGKTTPYKELDDD